MHRVHVAERLRRQTANLIPSGCAGSNPVVHVEGIYLPLSLSLSELLSPSIVFLFFLTSFSATFSAWLAFVIKNVPRRVGFAKEHVLGEPS